MICGGLNLWQSIFGVLVCSRCHPPAAEWLVARRLTATPAPKPPPTNAGLSHHYEIVPGAEGWMVVRIVQAEAHLLAMAVAGRYASYRTAQLDLPAVHAEDATGVREPRGEAWTT